MILFSRNPISLYLYMKGKLNELYTNLQSTN